MSGKLQPTPQTKRARGIAKQAAYWLLPSLICLLLHRDGLRAWFQADDFAWLGLNNAYHDTRTFFQQMFQPAAQGTIRPLSERLFFFAFWHWFGWNALAWRVFIFLNQCLNLILFSLLVRCTSGSAAAGFIAPVLWMANAAVVVPMAWTSAYNEVLCATFLLSALLIWVRFCRSGRQRYYWAQLAIFVVGFGALELNLVYPALAAVWALFYSRKTLIWTAPLFAISAAYYKLHAALVPLQTSGPYQPHFDLQSLSTLVQYWKLVFIPPYGFITVQPALAAALVILATGGILLFTWAEARRQRFAPLFFLAWFFITLAPLLPFRDHLTHYYLFLPAVGIAAIAALALERWKFVAAPVILLFLWVQLPIERVGERWYLDRSLAVKTLVMGVKQIHEWEPDKAILLTDVSAELYGTSIADSPFRLFPNARVYLAPEALTQLTGLASNLAPVSKFALPAGPTRHALLERQLVVYSTAPVPAPLREVTAQYTAQNLAGPDPDLPRFVDVGSPLLSYLLGPEWYPIEGAYRWMAKRATLRMAGPRIASEKLYVNGFASPESLLIQPHSITVRVDKKLAGTASLGPHDSSFVRAFSLPAESVGRPSVEIELEVNRTFKSNRELGIVFGTFEIR